MERPFDAEHDTFRVSARRFFQEEIGPHTERWRAQGQVDRWAFRRAGELGYLLMWADPQYGGAGEADFRYELVLIEENARFGDRGFYLTLHSRIVAPYIGSLGTPEQRERFLSRCVRGESILAIAMTEPNAGSDLAGMKTRATQEGSDWIINGSKTYISNGQIADVVIVAARTVPGTGHGIGLFLVEQGMPGFRRGRNLKKMGFDAQDTSELFFDNVRVPATNVLGDPSKGFRYLMQFLAQERLCSASGAIASAQLAFDLTLEFVRNRSVFGQRLSTMQNTRFKMAALRAELDALQSFVDQCALQLNRGRLTAADAAKVKLLASELEGRVVDECLQLHGGAGYMEDSPICRLYRNARVSRIFAGTSEIMKEIISRDIGME